MAAIHTHRVTSAATFNRDIMPDPFV